MGGTGLGSHLVGGSDSRWWVRRRRSRGRRRQRAETGKERLWGDDAFWRWSASSPILYGVGDGAHGREPSQASLRCGVASTERVSPPPHVYIRLQAPKERIAFGSLCDAGSQVVG